jgi:integrase/recombinase XerD
VLHALERTPRVTEKHFFWDGETKLEIAVGSWRRRLAALFELSKVKDAHPHRFRDTFAVELLLSGVPIERVSILLAGVYCECSPKTLRIPSKSFHP